MSAVRTPTMRRRPVDECGTSLCKAENGSLVVAFERGDTLGLGPHQAFDVCGAAVPEANPHYLGRKAVDERELPKVGVLGNDCR
jgi:hypothetical protein